MNSFEAARSKQNSFGNVCASIYNLLQLAEKYPQLSKCFEYTYEKKESNFIEYQHKENTVERVLFRDRKHPVDTVILNDFNRKTGANIESAKLVYGPSADEYTRSHHALAIAVANTIYFRNGAYKPETEEGRKLLAHELSHVAQNKEKEDYRNISTDVKEKEAEEIEKKEEYNPDKIITRKVGGKEYSLKESVWKKIDEHTRKTVEEKVDFLRTSLSEEEYLKLLIKYKEWEESVC